MVSGPVKIAAGIGGGGVVIATTTKLALDAKNSNEVQEDEDSNPKNELIVLSEKIDFTSDGDYSNGTFGYAFGRFMVDPSYESGGNDIEQELNKDSPTKTAKSSDFQKSANSPSGYIKTACQNIYKKQKSEVTGDTEKDAGNFCSPLGKKPKSISEVGTNYSDKGGGEADVKPSMLADSDENKDAGDHLFKHVYSKESSIQSKYKEVKDSTSLRNACVVAYSAESSSNTESGDYYDQETINFCSIDYDISPSKIPLEPSR